MLAIKLVVTPALMLLVSLVARRWGGFVGGVLAGAPLTSGPITVYIAVEQGAAFAARGALGSLAGLAAIQLASLAYVAASARRGIPAACAVAFATFALASWLLAGNGSALVRVAVTLAAVAALLVATRTGPRADDVRPRAVIDLPLRLVTATGLVLLVTGAAPLLGPELSGAIAPLPVIAWPLTVFTHRREGRAEALAVIRGNALGAVGVMAFYLMVAGGLVAFGPLATFTAAISASLAVVALVAYVDGARPRARRRRS